MTLRNKLDQRFPDATEEARFRTELFVRWLPFNRLAIALSVVFYASFALVDPFVASRALDLVLAIRFGLVVPLLAGLFLLTFTPIYERWHETLSSLAMASIGASIVVFVGLIGSPGNYLYSFGIDVVLIYGAVLTSLRYVHVAAVGVLLAILYQPTILAINPMPLEATVVEEAFMMMSLAVSVLGSYLREYYIRQNFLNAARIDAEMARSSALLAEANAASLAKSTFLANMSHELRTPLNAIIGFSEIIMTQAFGATAIERYRTYAGDINSSGQHLLRLVNDILDLSKSAAGHLELSEAPCAVAGLVEQSVELVRPQTEQKKIAVHIRVAADLPPVLADELRLKQALVNLLSNAVKFSGVNSEIAVTAALDAERNLAISVVDHGIGMRPEEIPIALQPFHQIDNGLARSYEGTGLGLPLANMLVEKHGGSLRIASARGRGTTVTIILPPTRLTSPARSAA